MNALIIKTFICTYLVLCFIASPAPAEALSLQCALADPKDAILWAKEALRKNRWDAKANACLSFAYERSGNSYGAIKRLRDAEEQLPQHVIDQIHDMLWDIAPELLARKEFIDRYTMKGGDCIIKNSAMIEGFGYLIIGYFFNPDTQLVMRHLAAFQCDKNMDKCRERSLICPHCTIQMPETVLKVRGYSIEEIYTISSSPVQRNLRYINTLLRLQREIYAR